MGDGTGCDNMTCIILRFDNLPDLAKCAVTRTCGSPSDIEGVEEDEEDELHANNADDEVKAAVETIEEVEEEEEEAEATVSLKANSPKCIPYPCAVVNGNGDNSVVSENVDSTSLSSSSGHSPVLKKARLDVSPQNGGDGDAALNSIQSDP